MKIWEDLSSKFLEKRLQHEATPLLDHAHYLAVSTGRIDPYLRALASETIYIDSHRLSSPAQCWSTPRRAIQVDSSPLNTRNLTSVGPKDTRGHKLRRLKNLQLQASTFPELINSLKPDTPYIVVDSGLATELTIELKYFPTIIDLAAGKAIPSALSAIGNEHIAFHFPTELWNKLSSEVQVEARKAYKDLSIYATTIAENLIPAAMIVELCGIGGKAFVCFLVLNQDQQVIALAQSYEESFQAKYTRCLLLNPATPNWIRDLCWEGREKALPLVDFS